MLRSTTGMSVKRQVVIGVLGMAVLAAAEVADCFSEGDSGALIYALIVGIASCLIIGIGIYFTALQRRGTTRELIEQARSQSGWNDPTADPVVVRAQAGVGAAILGLLIGSLAIGLRHEHWLRTDTQRTTAVIMKEIPTRRGQSKLVYEYVVNQQLYTGTGNKHHFLSSNKLKPGDHPIIYYSAADPSFSRLHVPSDFEFAFLITATVVVTVPFLWCCKKMIWGPG
jgi:hypothetical protein